MSKYTTIEIVSPTTGSVPSLERSAVGDIAIDPYNDAWVKQSDQKWHFEDDGYEETATGMVERYNRLIVVHLPTKEVTNTVNVDTRKKIRRAVKHLYGEAYGLASENYGPYATSMLKEANEALQVLNETLGLNIKPKDF